MSNLPDIPPSLDRIGNMSREDIDKLRDRLVRRDLNTKIKNPKLKKPHKNGTAESRKLGMSVAMMRQRFGNGK